jgi:hypothetical protein
MRATMGSHESADGVGSGLVRRRRPRPRPTSRSSRISSAIPTSVVVRPRRRRRTRHGSGPPVGRACLSTCWPPTTPSLATAASPCPSTRTDERWVAGADFAGGSRPVRPVDRVPGAAAGRLRGKPSSRLISSSDDRPDALVGVRHDRATSALSIDDEVTGRPAHHRGGTSGPRRRHERRRSNAPAAPA